MPAKKKTAAKKKAVNEKKKNSNPYDAKERNTEFNFGETSLTVPGVGSGSRGFEEMDESDIIVPQLKILQGLSPLVIDNPKEYHPGMLVNSGTNEILAEDDETVIVQLVNFYKNRLMWRDKKEGGGILCASRDGKQATQGLYADEKRQCIMCPMSQWGETKSDPPKCTLYYNYPLLYWGKYSESELRKVDPKEVSPQLMWISFGRTNFPYGKKLLNQLRARGDIFSNFVRLYAKLDTSDSGYKFYLTRADVSSKVSEVIYKAGENAFKFLMEMKSSVKFGEDEDSAQEAGYSDVEDNDEI